MQVIDYAPFSTAPKIPLEGYLVYLPKVAQREGVMLASLLRQKPLSALHQLCKLQESLLTSGLSEQGERDLQVFLIVLTHYAHNEAKHPLYVKMSTQDNVMFWRACVELEIPLLLIELLGSEAIFAMTKYCKYPELETPPPWFYAFGSLLNILRVWASMCKNDDSAFQDLTRDLTNKTAPAMRVMWSNFWNHRVDLFDRFPRAEHTLFAIMDLAKNCYEIPASTTGPAPDLESSSEMLHLLFWAWTYYIRRPCDQENRLIYMTYALASTHSHGIDKVNTRPFISSLFSEVGKTQILSQMATVIADSQNLYGVELENAVDIFNLFLSEAGRETFDRIPVLPALQRALVRYKLNMERPGYGYGYNRESDEYRKLNLLLDGFELINAVLTGLVGTQRAVDRTVASEMMATLLSLLSIAVYIMGKYDQFTDTSEVSDGVVMFFLQWARFYPTITSTKARSQKRRTLQLPRSFVTDMRRAALEQGRWYATLCELREASVKPRCLPLQARLLEHWKEFGRTLDLPAEGTMEAALRTGRAHLCHRVGCQYNVAKAPEALKTCRGCGEVYYCSKPCQKKDWNEGGHKFLCGHRLVSVTNT